MYTWLVVDSWSTTRSMTSAVTHSGQGLDYLKSLITILHYLRTKFRHRHLYLSNLVYIS